jgi:hypothetical protein
MIEILVKLRTMVRNQAARVILSMRIILVPICAGANASARFFQAMIELEASVPV